MKSDITIRTLGLTAAFATALTTTAAFAPGAAQAAEVEGPKVKWLVSLWGARRGFTEGVEGLKEELARKTDGNFELDLQYGGVLSDPKENIDGLQLGAFEAATVCPFYHPDKTPASMGLSQAFLPLPSFEVQYKVYGEYLKHPAVKAEWDKWNATPIMSALMPNYEIMGKGEIPAKLADWSGVRVNASGGHAALMESLGAVPSTMPAPDLYNSLERGVIDGIVYPYTYAFVAYRFHELSTWVTDAWNLGTIQCTVAANTDAYNALPEQYKALLAEAVVLAYAHQIAAYAEIDKANEAEFDARGLKRVPLTDDVKAALEAAVKPSWQSWIDDVTAKGIPGQELFDMILSEAEKARAGQ
ncbi:TRAP transporter substrate-binding protein DctP [Seohaeicola zhoushanensis]|uniref:C4-dicarboxylate ABC transporter substrate-binding protein n=1 Tax=Seohaeicola zhoushanensis TaxID=1569283 RepID=A0A8J3M7L2_9RHOB|nr:TRAP transporter substrate-binding protein DctP [Seohaeicola zhoushanensis]GHF48464.1 C4-dicarboxylate ABC transporter substrate-binding protein [Seohaeicola zhoushanensis]